MPDQTFSEELYDDKALKDAVDRMANLIKTHATKAYVDSAVKEKQDALTFDSTPTAGSTNPVTSGGIKAAVDSVDTEIGELKSALNATVEFTTGKNIANPNDFEIGYLESNGNVDATTNRYMTTGFIDITGETDYVVAAYTNILTKITTRYMILFYDGNKTPIANSYSNVNRVTELTAESPNNAKYMRACAGTDPVYIQVEAGTSASTFKEYAKTAVIIAEIPELSEQGTNLFNAFVYDQMEIQFSVNEAYISYEFKPNPNRISFDVPYPFSKGSKIDITVGTGEKFYMMYFRKVNNTGIQNADYEYISGSGTGWQSASNTYIAQADVYVYVMAAFAVDTAITKDTVKTKAVITKAYTSADTDALPSYWETYLQTKNGLINSAMDAIGGNGDAFVFYTDPHWGIKNQKHTPQIIQNMLDNTALRIVYCGGDVIDSGSGGFTEYCKAFREITVFTARGNHDQNPNAQDASDIVPDSEYYNRILKPIEYLVNTDGKLYFYRDNASEKIRYIFMDSGSARADTLDTTQLTWMQNALTELESDWSALVIQHVVFTGAEASSTAPLNFAGQGTKTINAINAVWEQMQCTFIGIVCGHVHRDYATTDSTYGYPIIATSCDVGGTGRTQYDPVNGATPGTTDEHILDVFVIDKENKTINTIRIGAGSDRTFSYGN